VCCITGSRYLVATLLTALLPVLRVVIRVLGIEGSGGLVVGVEWAGVWTAWVATSGLLTPEEGRVDTIHVGDKWKGVRGGRKTERYDERTHVECGVGLWCWIVWIRASMS